ncbi:MAG: GNA1162 family protein [bacterium]
MIYSSTKTISQLLSNSQLLSKMMNGKSVSGHRGKFEGREDSERGFDWRGDNGNGCRMTRIGGILLVLFLIVAAGGCTGSPKGKASAVLQMERVQRIKRIAVLPFYNLSERLDAEIIVTNLFISEIANERRFSVVKYGDVQEFLWQHNVQSTETITKEVVKELVDRFSVEGVILGTINQYREWSPDGKEPAVVEISARLVDCENGQTVWFGRETRTGRDAVKVFDIGEIRFCSQLTVNVARDFLKELGGRI